jgi:UDP-N-acetylglucosamine 2-epimerase (non-hydrolysing)
MMVKILFLFGTRPEAIKMSPIIKEFLKENSFIVKTCVTAQHRGMLDQVLNFFEIIPDYDLNLMRPGQNLYSLTADIISSMQSVLEEFKPDYVLVHGDTTTSTAGALAAFYSGAKVCHVEAGLRTHDKKSPFPEELNRQITSRIADIHFAPTQLSRINLLNEGIDNDKICVFGNSVIDALFFTINKLTYYSSIDLDDLKSKIIPNKKIILVTGHRRENFGNSFIEICNALLEISKRNDVQIFYPVHLNPNIQKPVYDILENQKNIILINPLSYPEFVWLMKESFMILTDSGGIQEEAPSLLKPVLVMRNTTERPEALENGNIKLVGTDKNIIIKECFNILDNPNYYNSFSINENPFGDGKTSNQILNFIKNIKHNNDKL